MELLNGGLHGGRRGARHDARHDARNDARNGARNGNERDQRAPVGPTNVCSSPAEVALLDAGDLTDLRRAAIRAHVRRCHRCERSLDEIRQARKELLGDTPKTTSVLSIGAATEIQRILRLRCL